MTKIESARQEYADWCSAVGIDTIEKLNSVLNSGRAVELINLCEARQERKYCGVADRFFFNRDSKRIVMMSGPSSSGKTSSSLRIAQQCKVLGLKPVVIELDNYFVDRERTPRDANGLYDFEALEAMDVEFLGEQLNDLLEGREIELPHFNFTEGKREFRGETLRLAKDEILFMEGIHALNPALTPSIDQNKIFRVYISALSALPSEGIEEVHNSTTDKRLLRRILRDNATRGTSPEKTILQWPSVRRGETRNIFPYEENADVVFNSSVLYDMPMLRRYAEPIVSQIGSDSVAYEKAQTLLKEMRLFTALKDEEIKAIPPTSIMREFIGGQML